MDRNDLLSATRAEYLREFAQSVDQAISNSVGTLYKKADSSYSSLEQVRFLDARSILLDRDADLRLKMRKSIEQLLNRSMQTTYSTFRPSFFSNQSGNLALVDSTAFEDELHIGNITNRFRGEAEEQLRDLNIRIAILFEQDNIKERENPFRPYLLSRSIATAIEGMDVSVELTGVLLDELAENMEPYVAQIFDAVNALLAGHGVAAQLQMKIKRSSTKAKQPAAQAKAEQELPAAIDDESIAPFDSRADAGFAPHEPARLHHFEKGAAPADTRKRTVDQLLDLVRGMATTQSGDDLSNAEEVPGQGQFAGASQRPTHMRGQGPAASQDHSGDSARVGASHSGGSNSGGSQPGGSHSGGSHSGGSSGGSRSGHNRDASHAQDYDAEDGQPDGGQMHASNSIAKAGWLAGKQVVGEVLRKFFSSDDVAGGANAKAGWTGTMRNATAQLATSVDQLIRDRTPTSAGLLADDGEIRNLVLEQRASLNSMTEDVDEQMTIDIVAMLFEFILRDPQVPAEVRAQLGRLQFLVLKIALLDTSLLTQKGHPARLLVNRIGSISLSLKQIDPSGVRITAEVCRIVELLLSDENKGAKRFLTMLDDFDAFIANELRASDEKVELAIELAEKTQSRTLRFVHATAKMNEALSGLSIDPFLHDFFVHSWLRVIERTERTDAGLARRFRLLVPDLLWSIVPKVQEQDRAQLFTLLPVILSTLREGLAGTEQGAERQQTLLNWLVDAHTSALRSGNGVMPVVSLPAIRLHFKKFIDNPEANAEAGPDCSNPAQYTQFLGESIKELDLQIQLLDSFFEQDDTLPLVDSSPMPASMGSLAPDSNESVIERLRGGIAIAINLGGKPSRGRLSWIDPNAGEMVLTLDNQITPSMISVRMFLRLYNNGRISFLETAPLFERAIESLLKSADNMDRKPKGGNVPLAMA